MLVDEPRPQADELPSSELDPANEQDDDGTSDSGSYMSSSFYASDQGEDSEDESYNNSMATSTVQLPVVPARTVYPTNSFAGLPFLPLREIASYLSLNDLSTLYHTHRQLKATIDEGSLGFFGRFWETPPRSEWVNRARRIYGWYDKKAHPGEVDALTKLGDVGMDEFWKQVKSAFWVSNLVGDRNDRAMIQQSFWSTLLSPENSPPPEPTSFASQASGSQSPAGPLPTSHTRLLRPTLSAGYRAYAQHGYVLTGAHHLLLLQHEACWLCLFAPEETSQGPQIKIIQNCRKAARAAGLKRRLASYSAWTSSADLNYTREIKTCDGCGGTSCGRHPTSAETARSLGLELSYLPPPSPVQALTVHPLTTTSRAAVQLVSEGPNPLQIYYRRWASHEEENRSEQVLAHFSAAADFSPARSRRIDHGGGWNESLLGGFGGGGAGGGGGGSGGGQGNHHHHFGGFAALLTGLNAQAPPPPPPPPQNGVTLPAWGGNAAGAAAPAPATAQGNAPPLPNLNFAQIFQNHIQNQNLLGPPAPAPLPAPTAAPTAGPAHAWGAAPQPQPQAAAPPPTMPPSPYPSSPRYSDWWVCASCAHGFGPDHAWSRKGEWE